MSKLSKEEIQSFEHLAVSNLLKETDPTYGEENRIAKQQLLQWVEQLLEKREREMLNKMTDTVRQNKYITKALTTPNE